MKIENLNIEVSRDYEEITVTIREADPHLKRAISRINWALLREQKLHLMGTGVRLDEGLLNMIDAIQDAVVDDGIATEKEVFG